MTFFLYGQIYVIRKNPPKMGGGGGIKKDPPKMKLKKTNKKSARPYSRKAIEDNQMIFFGLRYATGVIVNDLERITAMKPSFC